MSKDVEDRTEGAVGNMGVERYLEAALEVTTLANRAGPVAMREGLLLIARCWIDRAVEVERRGRIVH
jgi:hypothetical protein